MRVRKFLPLATLNGDKVSGVLPTGLCGFIYAELPNADVEPEQRILAIPIQNKSDYKSSLTLIWIVALSLATTS